MKVFVEPKIDIIEFSVVDIITASGQDPEDNEVSRD